MKTIPQQVYEEIRTRYGVSESPCIVHPEDILQIKKVADLSSKSVEYFVILTISAAGTMTKYHEITKGLLNHSLVHPREVFREAIKDNAIAIIAIHNHPSGSLDPSQEDISVTKQIKQAGDIIGISLLDHIIISKNGVNSLRSLGYL